MSQEDCTHRCKKQLPVPGQTTGEMPYRFGKRHIDTKPLLLIRKGKRTFAKDEEKPKPPPPPKVVPRAKISIPPFGTELAPTSSPSAAHLRYGKKVSATQFHTNSIFEANDRPSSTGRVSRRGYVDPLVSHEYSIESMMKGKKHTIAQPRNPLVEGEESSKRCHLRPQSACVYPGLNELGVRRHSSRRVTPQSSTFSLE